MRSGNDLNLVSWWLFHVSFPGTSMFLIKPSCVGSPGTNVFTDWYSETRDNHSIYWYIYIHSLCPGAPPFPVSPVSDLCVFKEAFFLRYPWVPLPVPESKESIQTESHGHQRMHSVWSFHSDPQSCSTCYCSVYESNYLIHSMNFQVLLWDRNSGISFSIFRFWRWQEPKEWIDNSRKTSIPKMRKKKYVKIQK